MEYEKAYDFDVTIVWAKPDGADVKETLSVQVTFYDLSVPDFRIDYDPKLTLITAEADALFILEPLNFAIDDIYSYEVEWTLTPKLEKDVENRTVLSGGRIMQILKGSYSPNTEYEITLSVTHKKLPKLSQEYTVAFETLAPPEPGTVAVSPLEGFIGDTFTIQLKDWTSANLPIEYNVYSSYDANGQRKGLLLNADGPIPVAEPFEFIAQRTTPVIVSVFDQSGETLEFTLNLQVKPAP